MYQKKKKKVSLAHYSFGSVPFEPVARQSIMPWLWQGAHSREKQLTS
jgi:hypothetical protein